MAVYDERLNLFFSPEAVILNNELRSRLEIAERQCIIGGTGAAKWNQFIENWQPELAIIGVSAIHMIPLAIDQFKANDYTETAIAKPFYLKLPNITTPREKLITR